MLSMAVGRRRVEARLRQDRRPAEDRGQRSSELVREDGEHPILRRVGLAKLRHDRAKLILGRPLPCRERADHDRGDDEEREAEQVVDADVDGR